MKLSILQQDLLPPLQAVVRSCGIRSTLPVLANILLETEEGMLKLSATNLELGVVKKIKADIQEEGDVTVPAKTFLEVVSSLQNELINLDSFEDQVRITTKSFNAALNSIPASEFPAIPLASENPLKIDAQVLQKSLPEIVFAAASDEGRPILTGILTEIRDDSLELVATDGFRLAHKTTTLKEAVSNSGVRYLIPRRTFEEVVRLISEEPVDGDKKIVEISTSENQNQIVFKIGQTQLSSRLIEGQFPSWEKIIPTEFIGKVKIDKSDILKAVKLASVFARGEAANIIKIESRPEGKIVLSSQARELGTQTTNLNAVVEGESVLVAFNSRFLVECLQNCPSDELSIQFSGNLSPVLVKPSSDKNLEYIIMPMRLS